MDLFYVDWPLKLHSPKPELIERFSTVGIVEFCIAAFFPVINLCRPLPGIDPATYRSPWNSE